MRYSNQSNYSEIFAESAGLVKNNNETRITQKFQDSDTNNKRKSVMAEKDEKLKFSDMLNSIKVIDSNDRVRLFKDCIEQEFQLVSIFLEKVRFISKIIFEYSLIFSGAIKR